MKRACVYLFALLCVVGGVAACGPTKSIQELNPGVSFMDKNEVMAFLIGAECESERVRVSYKEKGRAVVYVKKIQKYIPGAWKVEEDGMITLMTQGHVEKWYISSDGTTSYNIDGTRTTLTKR